MLRAVVPNPSRLNLSSNISFDTYVVSPRPSKRTKSPVFFVSVWSRIHCLTWRVTSESTLPQPSAQSQISCRLVPGSPLVFRNESGSTIDASILACICSTDSPSTCPKLSSSRISFRPLLFPSPPPGCRAADCARIHHCSRLLNPLMLWLLLKTDELHEFPRSTTSNCKSGQRDHIPNIFEKAHAINYSGS